MKRDEILKYIKETSQEFSKVRRILENEKLEDEVQDLTFKIKELEHRILKLTGPKRDIQYDPDITLCELEKTHILAAVKYFDNNVHNISAALGITIKTLYNKLHEYGEFEKFQSNLKVIK